MAAPIFLVAGPASAGKTTTSRALAARFPRSVHVPVDGLRAMVCGGLVQPGPDWGAEVREQLLLARRGAMAMADAYAAAGFATVIDDLFDPLGMAEYEPLLARSEARAILLLADPAEAGRRNLARAGGPDPTADRAIAHAAGFLPPRLPALRAAGWLVLDTTALGVEAVVDEILAWAHRPGR